MHKQFTNTSAFRCRQADREIFATLNQVKAFIFIICRSDKFCCFYSSRSPKICVTLATYWSFDQNGKPEHFLPTDWTLFLFFWNGKNVAWPVREYTVFILSPDVVDKQSFNALDGLFLQTNCRGSPIYQRQWNYSGSIGVQSALISNLIGIALLALRTTPSHVSSQIKMAQWPKKGERWENVLGKIRPCERYF